MYPVTFAKIEMGSVIIGVALIALVAIIVLACIFRLDSKTMLEVFKFLGPIIGLIVGTMGTYFLRGVRSRRRTDNLRWFRRR